MRNVKVGLLCLSALLIAACEPGTTDNGDNASSSSARSSEAQEASSSLPRETANVSYTGVVQPSGISIYMEGTHRLVLEDGRFLLLSSETLDLDDYVGVEVNVHGAIRPTVEGNGMIMRVERVVRTASSSAESVASSEDASSSSASSDSSASVVSSAMSSMTSVSSAATSKSSAVSSVAVSSAVSAASSAASVSGGADIDARAAAMAKDDLSADRWTQRYCSTHIGFCVDIHKNWWYKSFGTTTNALWNVEVSSEEIEMPGDGPIKIKLLSGELSGATDGQVKVQNGMAIGYRAWTEGRHFEVSGPSVLQEAVRIITGKITQN